MDKRGTLTAFISCKARPQDVKALATLARRRGQNKSQVVRAVMRKALAPETGLVERVRTMSTNSRKAEPQAGDLGHGRDGNVCHWPPLDAVLSGASQTPPTVYILPQTDVTCQDLQVRMTCQKTGLLALIDDVLERCNRANWR
jgi:hypothetical protein